MAAADTTRREQRTGGVVHWALLLHVYQPPHQLLSVLRRVVEEAYLPLIEVFRHRPHARATVNISGVLTDMLWNGGFREVITGLRDLAERRQIEFTGSGKYHPILPLIPETERVRQVRLNFETNRRHFGEVYQPRGFFPPELAYSEAIVPAIASAGYQWMLLSGVACPAPWPTAAVHRIPVGDSAVAALFRDDILSNKVSFKSIDAVGFLEEADRLAANERDTYIITAMDGETFGHHLPGWDQDFLAAVFDLIAPGAPAGVAATPSDPPGTAPANDAAVRKQPVGARTAVRRPFRSVTLSEIVDRFPAGNLVRPEASSWSTTPDDLHHHNPFPLWDAPDNTLHALLWRHLYITMDVVAAAERLGDNEESRRFAALARTLLDQAEHSCQFWWASRRPMWDINMVHRGLLEQQEAVLNAARAVRLSGGPTSEKAAAALRADASRVLSGRILDALIDT